MLKLLVRLWSDLKCSERLKYEAFSFHPATSFSVRNEWRHWQSRGDCQRMNGLNPLAKLDTSDYSVSAFQRAHRRTDVLLFSSLLRPPLPHTHTSYPLWTHAGPFGIVSTVLNAEFVLWMAPCEPNLATTRASSFIRTHVCLKHF